MEKNVSLHVDNQSFNLPLIVGSEGEKAIDIRKLRSATGNIAYDDGYANTGSCKSDVTFIDGENGILRYRGYSVEDLAHNASFLESAWLVINGELPKKNELEDFSRAIALNAGIHESMYRLFDGFPTNSHPMAILSALLNTLGCYYPDMTSNNRIEELKYFEKAVALLISKVRTIAAMTYRIKSGLPVNYPDPNLRYSENFLHLMFSNPHDSYPVREVVGKALDLIFLLHVDHEQNCSTSTVRMVASGGANLFASVSAGVCALWGPLHGGANMGVIQMLRKIHDSGDDGSTFIENAKNGKSRLMGFGHRVYKNYDPRAKILGQYCEKVLKVLGKDNDPLLSIAQNLERQALADDYFVSRKLYPNVDFYSGIILQAIGLPLNMFTVIFAIGRMPGWIAHWKEIASNPKSKIHRPRQIYTGYQHRPFVPLDQR